MDLDTTIILLNFSFKNETYIVEKTTIEKEKSIPKAMRFHFWKHVANESQVLGDGQLKAIEMYLKLLTYNRL